MNSLYKNAARFGAVSLVLAASLASMHAQDTPRTERKSGPGEGLRRFLEGFGSSLDDEKRDELNRALEDFSKGLEEGQDRPEQSERGRPSDIQEPRGSNESDRRRGRVERVPQEKPSTPRAQRQNQRAPGSPGDQLRQQMEQLFPGLDPDRFFGDDFFGPLLREMNRMQGAAGEDDAEGPGGGVPWMQGQKGNARNSRHEKAARRAMAEFRPVVKQARDSVVTLYGSRDEQLALATIVTADGYALTKASALDNTKSIEAEFSDGRTVKAEVVDSLERYDLALLKLEADNLKPIEWNITENLPVGTLIAATSPDEDPLAIGVISVPARSLDSSRKGFLGVGMDGAEGGVKITNVSKKSAAEKVGLQVDDIITAIDGRPIRSPKELTDYITRKKAEDEVHIGYRRGTEDKVAVATLQSRDDMVLGTTASGEAVNESELKRLQRESDPTARMGGRGNRIADGFPSALQNDLLIETNQVGGPAVDLDGKAIALNIARAERTKTYSIPAATVAQLLVNVQQGKLTEPKDSTDLKRDARKADETLEQLRSQLKEAEERARLAREALEKQVR